MGRRGLTRSSHPITFTLALVLVACGGTNTAPSTTTAAAAAATEPEGQVVIAASPELFSSRLIADFAAKSGCHATLVPPAVDGVVPAGVDLIELRSDQVSAFTASGTTRSPAVPDSIPQSLRVPGAMPYLWEAELLAVPDGSVQRPSLRVLFAPGRSGSVALPDSPSMLALVARYLGAAKPFRLTAEQLASVRRLLTLAPPRLYTSRERLQQLFTTSTPVVVVSSA